eukprot:gene8830-6213_t
MKRTTSERGYDEWQACLPVGLLLGVLPATLMRFTPPCCSSPALAPPPLTHTTSLLFSLFFFFVVNGPFNGITGLFNSPLLETCLSNSLPKKKETLEKRKGSFSRNMKLFRNAKGEVSLFKLRLAGTVVVEALDSTCCGETTARQEPPARSHPI